MKKLAAGLTAALSLLVFAPMASAVDGSTAQAIANGESANICPRHSGGVCIKRRVDPLHGLGNGRWSAVVEGWERGWYEPWVDAAHARWYTYESFTINSNGSISGRNISG